MLDAHRPSRRIPAVLAAVLALLTGTVAFGALGRASAQPSPSEAAGPAASAAGASTVTGITPFRVLDTRDFLAKPGAGDVVNVTVTDGTHVPNDGSVTAVVLNLVALEASAPGFVSAYAGGTPWPGTSSLNIAPGQIQSAQVTVPVGADGSVDLLVQNPMNLVLDVSGYHQSASGAVAAGRTVGVTPDRVLDSRTGDLRIPAGGTLTLDLSGYVGTLLPADVSTVVLSVTGVDASGPGWLDVRPGGAPFAGSSALNFDIAGDVVANQVLARLSASKTLTIQAGIASADVVVDLTGYVTGASATPSEQGLFVPAAARLLDTRDTAGPAGGRVPVSAAGEGGLPATGVAGLAVNVTLAETSGPMFAAALPTGAPAGGTSTVNATRAGQTVAAPGIVFSGQALDVVLQQPSELVVDLVGWYTDEATTSTTTTSTTSTSTTSTTSTSTTSTSTTSTTSAPPVDPVWADLADLPQTIESVSNVELDGYMYVAGGGCQSDGGKAAGCTGFHRRYDPATNTYSTLAALPTNIGHIQSVTTGGKIYYIGGLGLSNDIEVNTVYIYDPATNTFSTGAPMPAARQRGASGVAVHDGKIYVAGGLKGPHFSPPGAGSAQFDEYDPATDTWTTLTDMPGMRDHAMATVVGDKLYLLDGRVSIQGMAALVQRTDVYDFTTGTWSSTGATIPTLRAAAAVAAVGSEIWVMGGETEPAIRPEVEVYDTVTDTWRSEANMPIPRHGEQASVCANGIYTFAGSTKPYYNPTRASQVLQLAGFTTCPKP